VVKDLQYTKPDPIETAGIVMPIPMIAKSARKE
jgi:hypothetical protein